MRETTAIDPDHLEKAVFSSLYDDDGVTVKRTIASLPMKYKNCCGDIKNQRAMRAVGSHIGNFIRGILGKRRDKKSLLQKIVGFFEKKIHNGKRWIK